MDTLKQPSANQESAILDFKAQFDPKHEWPELVKDIVAMANSGGGKILVGVNDDGTPSGADVTKLLGADLADIVNKIRAVTDVNFADFTIDSALDAELPIAEITIGSSTTPLVFSKPGNYADVNGKPQCAFRSGTLYVRHGPKSEPATSDDIRSLIERHLERQRAELMSNLRQVIEAPPDATIRVVVPKDAADVTHIGGQAVRLVEDSDAKDAVVVDVNASHPYVLKAVIGAVKEHFGDKVPFNSADNLAVRRAWNIDAQKRYTFRPKVGSTQYSEAYVKWLIGQIEATPDFLTAARKKHHDLVVAQNIRRRAVRYF